MCVVWCLLLVVVCLFGCGLFVGCLLLSCVLFGVVR